MRTGRAAGRKDDPFTADVAFDMVPDWIALIDTDCTIRRANQAFAAAFGLTTDEVVGKKCHDLVHGSDAPVDGCPHLRLVNDSGSPTSERVAMPGKGTFDVRCSPLRDAGGVLVGSVHLARDASAEERAESHLLRALRIGHMGSWEWDIAGESLTWSEEVRGLWGIDGDLPLSFDEIARLVHPGDQSILVAIREQLLGPPGAADVRFRVIRPDGELRHVHLTAETARDAAGEPLRAFGIMRDITEKVVTREALRDREALLRGLFDTMPSGCAVFEVRGDGRSAADYAFKEVNPAALRVLDRRKTDVVGRSLAEAQPEMDEHAIVEVFWRVWRTGDPERYSAKSVGGEGFSHWYDTYVFRLPTGEIVAVYNDVTAERRADEALRASEAELHAIFDLAGIPMLMMDTRGGFRRWNRAALKALGYPEEDVARMTIRDVTPPDDRAAMLRRFSGGLADGGTAYRTEREFLTVDGHRLWFDVSVTPVRDDNGDVVALIGAGTDVTEARRAKDALVAREEQLREALGETVAAMGAVVALRDPYTAGHELRVEALVAAIATELGLAPDVVTGLRHAASVHDVGKVAVPAEILTMPRRLSDWEYSLVQTHVEIGHEVLAGIGFEQPVAEIVLQHHERLDGSGYPRGLKGDQITLAAQILAVADVVEAMASHRPYRQALGVGAALDEIGWGAGRLYDEDVVAACRRVVRRGVVDLSKPGV